MHFVPALLIAILVESLILAVSALLVRMIDAQ